MGTRGIDTHPSAASALDRVPPWSLVLAGATSIQFGAAIAATIFDDLGPAGTSLLRLAFAAVILLAAWRPRPSSYSRPQLRAAAAFGATLGLMNFLFYEGLDRVPLGIAVTIEFVGPLGVAVLGSRRRLDVAWALLAAAGIVLLAGGGGDGAPDTVGVLLVLGAGLAWGAYILLAQHAGRLFRGGEGLALASVVAALVPLGPGIAQGGGELLHPGLLALGLVVALMSSVIPYSVETEALRRMPANVFGVLMSLEPAVAVLAGFLLLGQALSGRDLLAIGCVVAASIGVTRNAGRVAAEA